VGGKGTEVEVRNERGGGRGEEEGENFLGQTLGGLKDTTTN